MYRFRLEYSKLGSLAYISHLDLARIIERAARRARLPMAFSQGYHPHAKFSFGSVLPVGMESDREYLDMELAEFRTPEEIKQVLNQQTPAGLPIQAVRAVPLEAPALMVLINTACYEVKLSLATQAGIKTEETFQQRIQAALALSAWVWLRKRAKGDREIDVRSGVTALKLQWEEGRVQGEIWLQINPDLAVRPVEVLEALERYGNLTWESQSQYIKRKGLYISQGSNRLSPLEVVS